MDSYQIGNKITCVVRAYAPCTIGDTVLTYKNEPYTILKDVAATLTFTDKEVTATTRHSRELDYNNSFLNSVRLSNVHLTDKVLHMLYQEYEQPLATKFDQVESDEHGKIYLSTSVDTIYQVFIYNESMVMVQAYGTINPNSIVLHPDTNYLVVYQELLSDAVRLDALQNIYYTLDLICKGNTSEQTSDNYIHIEKVGLRVDRQMSFNRNLNAVDLIFNVISTEDNYLTLK